MFFRHVVKEVDVGERPAGKLLSLLSSLLLVVVGRLKIVWSLPSMFLKQIWLVELSSSTVVPPTLHYFVMIIGTPPKSLQKRSNKMREEKGKEVEKGWELKIDNNNQPHLLHHVHPTIVLPWHNQLIHIQQSDPVIPVTKNPTWLQHWQTYTSVVIDFA